MADGGALQARVLELAQRDWEIAAIEARVKQLVAEGIPTKELDRSETLANRQQILDRVQRRAEEYNFIARNCARGTALAVLEEFGLGSMDVITALSPFPGFGGTGWMCGGVTGGLVALGLYFGRQDVLDYDAVGAAIGAARQLMGRFQDQVGSVLCPRIQEEVVFGQYMDAASCPDNMEAFAQAKGFEKCGLLPGIGARLAAELIIESMR